MSRSGYKEDNDDPLAYGRWRHAVNRSIKGRQGQAMLRELVEALDAMPDKRLYSGSFATDEGKFCALGVLGKKRGIKMDDLVDEYNCDIENVAQRFGIAPAMAAEIMYINDEYAVDEWKLVDVDGSNTKSVRVYNDNHPQERWQYVREWAVANLKTPIVK
jgi:hypothetical protein